MKSSGQQLRQNIGPKGNESVMKAFRTGHSYICTLYIKCISSWFFYSRLFSLPCTRARRRIHPRIRLHGVGDEISIAAVLVVAPGARHNEHEQRTRNLHHHCLFPLVLHPFANPQVLETQTHALAPIYTGNI